MRPRCPALTRVAPHAEWTMEPRTCRVTLPLDDSLLAADSPSKRSSKPALCFYFKAAFVMSINFKH
jgi:hypothetical protein